jgi:hypothetical protein
MTAHVDHVGGLRVSRGILLPAGTLPLSKIHPTHQRKHHQTRRVLKTFSL